MILSAFLRRPLAGIVAAFSLAACFLAQPLAQNIDQAADGGTIILPPQMLVPDMPGKATEDFAQLIGEALAGIQNWGVRRRVSAKILELMPRVAADLQYVDKGGILVIARISSVRTEIGDYQDLIGDTVDYVGIGTSPADANIAYRSRDRIVAGGDADMEASTSYWLTKNANGVIEMRHSPLSWLRQGTFRLYSERAFKKFDWDRARSDELGRIADKFTQYAKDQGARAQVMALEVSRRDSLKKLEHLNARLARELHEARKASENAKLLELIGAGLSVAEFGLQASKDLSPASQATIQTETTKEGIVSKLQGITETSNSEATLIERQIKVDTIPIDVIERQQIWIMQKWQAPVENLPPSIDPDMRLP